jgi:hypothetical protein
MFVIPPSFLNVASANIFSNHCGAGLFDSIWQKECQQIEKNDIDSLLIYSDVTTQEGDYFEGRPIKKDYQHVWQTY